MSKNFLIAILVCLLGLFGVFKLTSKKTEAPSSPTTSKLSQNLTGDNKKKVTLVEYGDYQCPACGQYHPLVKQVVAKYSQDIQFQFRNYPLSSLHPNAWASARSAEAAGKQGKYWEMHDKLYETQDNWKDSKDAKTIFEGYATELGLNLTKFKTDFASSAVNDTINADYAEGSRLGIQGTPTFFLQGKKITNPQTLDAFNKLIDDAIKNAK